MVMDNIDLKTDPEANMLEVHHNEREKISFVLISSRK